MKRLGMTLWSDLDNPKARNLVWLGSRTLLLPLSIIGLVMAYRRGWALFFPMLMFGSCLLTYSLTVTANRFSLPFEPLQLGLVALVIAPLIERRAEHSPNNAFEVMPASAGAR